MAHAQTLETIIALRGRVDNSVAVLGDTITLLGSQVNRISQQLIRFGTDSLDVFKDYEQNMADAEAALRTGTYRDRAAELEGVMDKLESHAAEWARTTKFHTSDVSAAISEAAHAGWDYLDMIEGIPAAMLLAQGGGMELTETLDYLVKALNATDTEFSDADKLIDQWITGANLGATNTREFGDAIVRMGNTAMFADSTEELFTLLTVLANVGATGSTAGTLLRNGMIRLIAPTEKANAAMDILGATSEEIEEALSDQTIAKAAKELETLGFTAFDEAGNLKPMLQIFRELEEVTRDLTEERRDQLLSAIFPTRSLSGALAILEAAKEDYGGIYEMIRDSAGAAQLASDIQMDTYEGRLEIFKSKWEELQRMTGEHLAPQVENVMAGLGGFIDTLTTMDPGKFDALLGGMEVLAGAGPALLLLGGAIKLLGSLGTAGGIGLVASLLVAGATYVDKLKDVDLSGKFGNMTVDTTNIKNYLRSISDEYRAAYEETREFANAVKDNISDFQSAAGEMSGSLLTAMLTKTVLTDEDKQKIYGLADEMQSTLEEAFANSTASSMTYFTALFGGEGLAEYDSNYQSIIDMLYLAYESNSDKVEQLGQEMRDALFAAFEDNVISSEEYQHLQELYDGFYDAAARAEADAKNRAEEVKRRKELAKASSLDYDQFKELQNATVNERDNLLAENDEERSNKYYDIDVKYDEAIANAETEEERIELTKQKNADLAAIRERQDAARAEESAMYDEHLLDLFESQMLGSDLSGAYQDALDYAQKYYNGELSAAELHDFWKIAYGGNELAGEWFNPFKASTSNQLGKMFAEQLDALGGYNEILNKVKYYESKGQHDTAQRLLDLYAASNIINGFSETRVEKDWTKMSMPWLKIGNEDYTEVKAVKSLINGDAGTVGAFEDATRQYVNEPITAEIQLSDPEPVVSEWRTETERIIAENPTEYGIALSDPTGEAADWREQLQAELDANPGSYSIGIRYTNPWESAGKLFGSLLGFKDGGRATSPSIFGEAGAEWAIPEEHSARTAALLDAAREASGFTWPELLARNGGLNSNPQNAPYTIVYSPTVYAQDARDVEQKLNDDKKRFEKWIEGYLSEKQLQKEVAQYA